MATVGVVARSVILLHPIVMTTATILCATLLRALKLEAEAESRAPMAVVVMGGVLSSTLLTLVFVPVMCTYLDDASGFLGRLFRRRTKAAPVATPSGGQTPSWPPDGRQGGGADFADV